MGFDISAFRAALAFDGARPNLFDVVFPFPAVLGATGQSSQLSLLAKSSSLPPSIIGIAPLMYFGREVKLAGNTTYPEWTITIINDEDMAIRTVFETWKNMINAAESNLRDATFVTPASYTSDPTVRHYGKTGNIVNTYNFVGAFPVDVSPVELDWGATDTIEEFTVTLQYQYWQNVGNGIL